MNDTQQLHAAIDEWNAALDSGDIKRLVATADPDIIICNEHQPTTIGLQALHDKYASRLSIFNFESSVQITDTRLFNDFALLVLHYQVKTTHKQTGQRGGGSGRLVLGYRRDQHGHWKLALDVDNNGPPE